MFGWGSEKIEDLEKSVWQIPMSEKLKELRIVIISKTLCNDIGTRKLKANEACARGYINGETATLVKNFDETCLFCTPNRFKSISKKTFSILTVKELTFC